MNVAFDGCQNDATHDFASFAKFQEFRFKHRHGGFHRFACHYQFG